MAASWGLSAAITPEWSVAPIPTDAHPDLTGGTVTPVRWPHHGDLRVVVVDDEVYVAVADLTALAGIDLDPVWPVQVAWAKNPDATIVLLYMLRDAARVLEDAGTEQAACLGEWMLSTVPEVLTAQEEDYATRLESFRTGHTVQQAAGILDRDPAVSIGRQSLFEHLQLIGWAERALDGTWQPTAAAIADHVVTIRMVTVRAGKTVAPYPQLYITPAGLTELRRTLRALHPDAPTTPAPAEQLPID